MRSLKLLMIAAVLALSACAAGTNFTRPAEDALVFGATTKAQVIAMVGKPGRTGEGVMNGERIDSMTYSYAVSRGREEAALPGLTPARAMTFTFHDGVLVGRDYISSFKSDSTWFDPEKARLLKAGMTEAEVLAVMGNPAGEFRYPYVPDRNGRAITYQFVHTRLFNMAPTLLVVEFDPAGVVQRIQSSQISSE